MGEPEAEDVNESDEELEFISQEGTTDYGHEYEVNMTALFALKLLLNEDVRDVLVASNAEGYGAFDDVVIRVEYYTKEPELYAIQLKHKLKEGSSIRTNDFNKKKGEFVLTKYKESCEAILNKLGDESDVLLRGITSKNVTLCIFTNAEIVDYKIFPLETSLLTCRLTCNSTQDFIDTNPHEFYNFQINSPCAKIPEYFSEILRDSYYSKIRKSVPEIASNSEELVNQFQRQLRIQFDEGQVSYETTLEQITSRFSNLAIVKYTERYFKQELKTASKTFSSSHFIKNSDYIQFVQERFETNFDDEEHDIRQSNMTLFERVTKEELKSYASKFSKENMRNPSASDDRFEDDVLRNISAHLKTYAQYKFKLKKKREYSSFFRCFQFYDRQVNHKEAVGKIGDLLRISFGEDRPEITKQIIEFVKAHFEEISSSSTDGYVKIKLLTKDILKLKLLELLTGIKDEQQLRKKYEIFQHITNIHDYSQRTELLKEINVSLQGRSPVTLYDISEESFHKTLSTSFLLKNMQETLHVGFKVNNLPDFYIERSFHRILLRSSVLWETNKNVFFFNADLSYGLSRNIRVLPESSILTDNSSTRPTNKNLAIIASGDNFSEIIEDIKQRDYLSHFSFHYLKVYSSKYLEWQRSWFGVASICDFIVDADVQVDEDETESLSFKSFDSSDEEFENSDYTDSSEHESDKESDESNENESEVKLVMEEEILQYFPNSLNIVNAVPGMGKTTTLKVLVGYCQPNILVLTIDLNTYDEDLQRKDSELRRNPLDFICNEMMSADRGEFEKSLFQHLKQERRLIVFLDSFDEISPTHSQAVSSIIEEVQKSEIPVWVFTRPNAKSHLEDRFSVLPINMVSLTRKDIIYYLTEKLHVSIDNVNNFLTDTFVTLYKAPLYLHMLSSIFSELSELQDLKLMELYARFVRKSFENYMAKRNIKSTEAIFKSFEVQYLEDHKTAALLAIFGKKYLIENKILDENDLKEVVGYFKDCSNNFELIVSLSDGIPVFFHKTYAEYFSAVKIHEYLSKKKFYILYELLFNQEFEPIRLMFDRITAKGNLLLSAVLEKNVQKICSVLSISELLGKDEFGRTALHFSLSYLQQTGLGNEKNAKSMRISDFILRSLEENELILEQRDKILKLNCYEHAEKCGNKSLVQIAAYWGALKVLELILSAGNCLEDLNRQETKYKHTALHVAILRDELECAFYLIEMGANVNLKDEEDSTPMHYAAKRGHTEILKMIGEKNGCVNGRNLYDWTPLHFAASESGNEECVTYLLEMGADINLETDDGKSPLLIAAEGRQLKILELFKAKKANDYAMDGMTALHYASAYGADECVKHLLETGGTDVNVKSKKGFTPLHCAAGHGSANIVKMLAEKNANLNEIDSSGDTAIHVALEKHSRICAADALIKAGADINIKNAYGKTPLHIACEKGFLEILESLLERRRANVNAIDSDGNTSLHLALMKRHKEIAKRLVEEGGDVNIKNYENNTPLYYVLLKGCTEIMELLKEKNAFSIAATIDADRNTALHVAISNDQIEYANYLIEQQGVDTNLKNKIGDTPLHCASRAGRSEILPLLIQKSLNINEVNADGNTALHLALLEEHEECALHLIAAGADINIANFSNVVPLQRAIYNGDLVMMHMLEKRGADFGASDLNESSLLHYAALGGDKDALIYLIEVGADVHLKNKRGCTPVHFAAKGGHEAILRYLKDKGAKVNETDFERNTPLHYAVVNRCIQCVAYLVTVGADVTIKNKYGCTPLDVAALKGYLDLLELLHVNEGTPHQSYYRAIHLAIQNNHERCAIYLIKAGANVDWGRLISSYISLVAFKGLVNLLKLFVEKIANINQVDSHGDTALHISLRTKHDENVIYLLKNGADINIKNNLNETPLHYAAMHGYFAIFRILKEKRAKFDGTDSKGNTILHYAARAGYKDTVICSKELCTNVNAKNNDGETPFHMATAAGDLDVLDLLIPANINETNLKGDTSLHIAAFNGRIKVVIYLVKAGADVNFKNMEGKTPIHSAALRGCSSILGFLHENAGKINETDDYGNTALHYASTTSCAIYLIKADLDVNKKNNLGETPIHLAAKNGYADVLKILNENNGDVNQLTKDKRSAFELALKNRKEDCAIYLLEAGGANVHFRDDPPLHYACTRGSQKLLQLLVNKRANLNEVYKGQTALHTAVSVNRIEHALYLIESGADVNIKGSSNKSPVHCAAENGHLNMLYILKENGADFDVIDQDGNTILHSASSGGHISCIIYLEKMGVLNLNAKNINGETPLHVASERGHLDVLKFLIKKGANVNEIDLTGSTSLHKAVSKGYVEAASFLSEFGADIDLENQRGQTPVHLAEEGGYVDILSSFYRKKICKARITLQ